MKKIKKGYWQALGVLRGTLQKEDSNKGGGKYHSLFYNDRSYSVFPSKGLFEAYREDLEEEKLYLVYPVSEMKKPYQLLKGEFGVSRAEQLALFPEYLEQLYRSSPIVRQALDSDYAKLLQANLREKLFGDSPYIPKMEDSTDAVLPFYFLNHLSMIAPQLDDEERVTAWRMIHAFNEGLGDTLFHPNVREPKVYLHEKRVRERETGQWAKAGLCNTLSFELVGFSNEKDLYLDEDGKPLKGGLRNGEFYLSGRWKPWKKNPSKAFFTSRMNASSDKDLGTVASTAAQSKKELSIFLDQDNPQIKEDGFFGAVTKFNNRFNCFQVQEVIEEYEQMDAPLNLFTKKGSKK